MNTSYLKQLGFSASEWYISMGHRIAFSPAWWMVRLDLGVKFFFSISGFILALPFLKQMFYNGKTVDIKDYLYRRLTRLEPPFVISLILLFIGQSLFFDTNILNQLTSLFVGLFYLHVLILGTPNPINPVTWSLETEAQFYLILPLIVALFMLFKTRIIKYILFFSLLFASIFFRSYTLEYNITHLSRSVLAYFVNFGTGIIFAYIYLKYNNYFTKGKYFVYDLLTFLAFFGVFLFYKPQALWYNNFLFNLSTLLFFTGVFKGSISNWIFTRPLIYLIGGMCYTIYLLHYALFHILIKFSSKISLGIGYWYDFILQFFLLFPIVMLISSIFYLSIEKPCMDKNWPVRLINYFKK